VPWASIRADLEAFSASQASLRKEIEMKRTALGDAYKGGGLLELCTAGVGDWYLTVKAAIDEPFSACSAAKKLHQKNTGADESFSILTNLFQF
jgi:hypothetical protein